MKIPMLVLAAVLAGSWAATSRAEDDDGGRVAVDEKDREGDSWDREAGPRGRGERRRGRERDEERDGPGRGEDRDGPGRREGRGGPGGRGPGRDADPELREKHDKYRDAVKKVRQLGSRLADAKDADKAAGKAEARKAVAELFDAKLAMDSAMLAKMEKHVAQAREKLAKRKSNRERLIDEKTARVVGDGDDDWD